MKQWMTDLQKNEVGNYILPFLWMKGEDQLTIRREIEKIHECGIGAICVEARPHPDFGKEKWWEDLGLVIAEAERLDMKVWILDDKHFPTGYANGLIADKYPERKKTYLNYNVCDIHGVGKEISVNIEKMKKPGLVFWEMGKQIDFEEREKNIIKKVLLMEVVEGKKISEKCEDVTDQVVDGTLTIKVPSGSYRVMVVYSTKTDGGNAEYINMLDETSCLTQIEAVYDPHYEHFKDKFGTTIMGFFSDEPQFGNEEWFPCDSIVGKKKMAIPWSNQEEVMLMESLGDDWGTYLPYLWLDSMEMEKCPKMRYEYMNAASILYMKNFSRLLGEWCQSHGVEYIGHVVEDNNCHSRLGMGAAHFFRAMDGQHMAGIDAIGGQVIFGGPVQSRHNMTDIDGEFFQYILADLGAASAHLDPKKKGRLMCELFGATGWETGVKEMRFVLDHLLAHGVNYLVPHAFSMAEYPDEDCPPHFYAGGNNPQFPYFGEMMHYANRMCELLNGGKHVASVALLYDAELEWSGEYMTMQKISRKLAENQIGFNIVAIDMLIHTDRYNTKIVDGKLVINGVKFETLIIPKAERIPSSLAEFISNTEVEVIFVDKKPKCIVDDVKNKELLEKANNKSELIELDKLVKELKTRNYFDVELDKYAPLVTIYHYEKEDGIYMVMNESATEEFDGSVRFNTTKKLAMYDGLENKFYSLDTKVVDNKTEVELSLTYGQSVVIVECDEETSDSLIKYEVPKCQKALDISDSWKVSAVRAIDYPKFGEADNMDKLIPYSRVDEEFSGIICYEKEITLEGDEKYFTVENVDDVMELWINKESLGKKIAPPFTYDISKAVRNGVNSIRVEVATTLEREQAKYPAPPFTFSFSPMLPTGMYGKVQILK